MSNEIISCVCPHCTEPLYAPLELLGTKVECQICLGHFQLEDTASVDEISCADTIMDPSGAALAALLAEMEEQDLNDEPIEPDSTH